MEEDVGRWKKDEKSATTVRDAERADFTATATDYSESIDAVAGAINVLKKQAQDKAQAALIQVSGTLLRGPHILTMSLIKCPVCFDVLQEYSSPLRIVSSSLSKGRAVRTATVLLGAGTAGHCTRFSCKCPVSCGIPAGISHLCVRIATKSIVLVMLHLISTIFLICLFAIPGSALGGF